jgi:hypothetical protein
MQPPQKPRAPKQEAQPSLSRADSGAEASVAPPRLTFAGSGSPRQEAKQSAAEHRGVYERLIKIFQDRSREDWKKLMAMSEQWPRHSDGVFARCKPSLMQG